MPTVEELFSKLEGLTLSDSPNHEQILGVLNEILLLSPDDADALRAKVVSLIQLSKLEQALEILASKAVLKDLFFERAYCLYRLTRNSEALEVLGKSPKPKEEVKVTQLRAQVLYRLGSYDESAAVYAKIADPSVDPSELAVNRAAALCAAGEAEKAVTVLEAVADPTSDVVYNLACAHIERSDMTAAMTALDEAERLYMEQVQQDELTAEEAEDGRIVFDVQRAYVRQRLGQADAALAGYEDALRRRPGDAEVAAVASNNLFALRGRDQGLFDTAKRARALVLEEGAEGKLTARQRRVFSLNRCLLALCTNNLKECGRALSKLEKEHEGSELPALVRAALLARERRMDECRALLQGHAQANPRTAALVRLTLAQLQVGEGDRAGAARTLETMDGFHRQLGVVASVMRLYESAGGGGSEDGAPQGGPARAAQAVEAALRAAEAEGAGAGGKELVRRLTLLAAEHLHGRCGDAVRAAERLERLVAAGDRDAAVVARLVAACAELDLARAEKFAEMLPPTDEAADLDVQELEAGPARVADSAPAAAGGVGVGSAEGAEEARRAAAAARRRERRKKERAVVATADGRQVAVEAARLPRRYAELVEMGSWGRPDPERWLPWHQRSYNRKLLKKRKGPGTASGGSQGGPAAAGGVGLAAAATLDRSEKFAAQLAAQAAAPAAAAASPAAAAGPPAGAAAASSKSHKKKGKK